MKQLIFILLTYVIAITATAQSMNVKMGDVTYLFYAEQMGEMMFGNQNENENGNTVTIMGKIFDVDDIDEITYVLSGTSADASLTMNGSYKCTIQLADLSLTNPNGAAFDIQNKKRIQIPLATTTRWQISRATTLLPIRLRKPVAAAWHCLQPQVW